jgi:hypothetical protein
MKAPFKPGDLAIICNKTCRCCNGKTVTIVQGPAMLELWVIRGLFSEFRFGYEVSAPGCKPMFCEPHQLRRLDPPAEDSDATPNALSKFDPNIWAPPAEIRL